MLGGILERRSTDPCCWDLTELILLIDSFSVKLAILISLDHSQKIFNIIITAYKCHPALESWMLEKHYIGGQDS